MYTSVSSMVCEFVAFSSFLSVSLTRISAMSYLILLLFSKEIHAGVLVGEGYYDGITVELDFCCFSSDCCKISHFPDFSFSDRGFPMP